jgi:hypothetical protein
MCLIRYPVMAKASIQAVKLKRHAPLESRLLNLIFVGIDILYTIPTHVNKYRYFDLICDQIKINHRIHGQ